MVILASESDAMLSARLRYKDFDWNKHTIKEIMPKHTSEERSM